MRMLLGLLSGSAGIPDIVVTANNDSFMNVGENSYSGVYEMDVLANDSFPAGSTPTITITSQSGPGTAYVTGSGTNSRIACPTDAGLGTYTINYELEVSGVTDTASATVGVVGAMVGTLDLWFEGGGADATGGGASGVVLKVTNNYDSGVGSFRWAAEQNTPRHIVFDEKPAGPIVIDNPLYIPGNVSVWGQTFGGELQIRGGPSIYNGEWTGMIRIIGGNCIFQYISPMRGMSSQVPFGHGYAFAVYTNGDGWPINDIMYDHIHFGYSSDDPTGAWIDHPNDEMRGFTWQNCVFSAVGQSTGLNMGTNNPDLVFKTTDMSVHRNLFTNLSHRMPKCEGYTLQTINNIMYNGKWRPTNFGGGPRIDFIGNIWREGPESIGRTDLCVRRGSTNMAPWPPSIYVEGNRFHNTQSGVSSNQWVIEEFDNGWQPTGNFIPSSYRRYTPLTHNRGKPVTVMHVNDLWAHMASHVGNSRHRDENGDWVYHRNSMWQGWIDDWLSNPGGLKGTSGYHLGQAYHNPNTEAAGLWPPTSFSGNYAAGADGIPYTWKQQNPGRTLEEFCLGYTRT